MNQIIIIGHLGSDPEMSYTTSGKGTTRFSVAVSRKYNDASGQRVESTDWFRGTVWDKLAETANQYLAKGHRVAVTGRVSMAEWEKDGQHRSALEINANSLEFLQPKTNGTDYNTDKPAEAPAVASSVENLPF